MPAPFVWFDLTGDDGQALATFYTELFGWTFGPGAGEYRSWMFDGERPWAGVVSPAGEDSHGRWVPYVAVADLDAATERATALGGRVVREAAIGPGGTSVIVADPGGALVALFSPALD